MIPREDDPNEALTHDLVWLGDVSTYNPEWLKRNTTHVYATIRAGLSSEFHLAKAVDAVFSFVELLVVDAAWKDWFEPVAEIVENHSINDDNLFESGFREVIADFRHLAGVYGNLDHERPARVDALLQAYIKLFKTTVFKHGFKLQNTMIDQAYTIAQKLDDHIEMSKLNHTLALYYTHYGDDDLAEPYAKLAFNDAEFIEDPTSALNAALTMATIYRDKMSIKKAGYYITRAVQRILPGQRDKLIATLFYEYAVVCYHHDNFELAKSYYERALSIFEELDLTYQIAMTWQAMSQVYIHMGDFTRAEELLSGARSRWETLGNEYEWVNTFFVEGDLELKRGKHSLGIRLLRQTIDKAYTFLPDTPARETLIRTLQAHIERNIEVAAR